jgi:hypothetical protein
MGLLRACISTFSGDLARGGPLPTQDERLRTFLVRRDEGKRSFTDGADARDGVQARDQPSDDPSCVGPLPPSTSRGLAASRKERCRTKL